ncbi:unnamed protein product [Didymodactylos carnosus]|uniref:Uncharacterized protein n=1 Tax=Didymodactylos carnosus TaxID=1234261 RepID=A0A814ILR1_9BILA|nr:unnamed protein product [Didymodactylos carnosus]CAF1464946.1 unnamed protein product [Didymodactylos carnosus]CAF3796837.1 unnamed protein product [Didymodactylos carnosus]CAF4257819.1 unnamed protein product [Didymodactylos carnosus]
MKMALHNINKTLITLIVLAVVITPQVASSEERKRRAADLNSLSVHLGSDSDYALFTYGGGDTLSVTARHGTQKPVNVGTMNVHLLSVASIGGSAYTGVLYTWTMAYTPVGTGGLWTSPGVAQSSVSISLRSGQAFSLQNVRHGIGIYTQNSSGASVLVGNATLHQALSVSITFHSSSGLSGQSAVLIQTNALTVAESAVASSIGDFDGGDIFGGGLSDGGSSGGGLPGFPGFR